MPVKKLIVLTAEMEGAVRNYQKSQDMPSWTQALLHLAALGLESETGQQPRQLKWGGWRGSEASLKALMDYADRISDGGRNDPEENE